MRKIILTATLLVSLFSTTLFGQTKTGDVYVDVYYGFPDWYYQFQFRNRYQTNGVNHFDVKSTGFIGARIESLISKRIGFGIDLWYANSSVSGTVNEDIYTNGSYDNNVYTPGPVIHNKYDIKESLGRVAALGRFIVHLGNSSKVDPYVHAGFGYVNYHHTYSNSNSNQNGYYNFNYRYNNNENYIPIAARAGFGIRIFFNEHLGANIDLGIGGALFTTGLTYKFFKKEE